MYDELCVKFSSILGKLKKYKKKIKILTALNNSKKVLKIIIRLKILNKYSVKTLAFIVIFHKYTKNKIGHSRIYDYCVKYLYLISVFLHY